MKRLANIILAIREIRTNIIKHHTSAYAAQSAFFTVLSVFPFLMSMITMLQFFPLSYVDMTEMILSFLPETFEAYAKPIIMETLETTTKTVMSLSIIVTLWTSSKGILALKSGLNTIKGEEQNRNYILVRLISCFYTFIFAIVLIVVLGLLVFGNHILQSLTRQYHIFADISQYFKYMRIPVSICILLLFFLLIYKALPDEKENLTQCIPGAVFSSVGWIIVSYAFSLYIDNFNNFSVMYGSLTGIIVTLLWLYFCMYMVFLGGELNYYLYHKTDHQFHRPIS